MNQPPNNESTRTEPNGSIHKTGSFSVGEWFTIIGIVAAAVAAFVRLEMRVNQLDPAKIKYEQDLALKAIKDVSPTSNDVPIGTIIASILGPTKFKELYGDRWVLADGRNIINTPLSVAIQRESIPDLRGMFLRGLNSGRTDQWSDPDKDRKPGDPQPDAFAKHSHRYGDNSQWGSGDANAFSGKPGDLAYNTEETGGVETRPKNSAVYYYIKIN